MKLIYIDDDGYLITPKIVDKIVDATIPIWGPFAVAAWCYWEVVKLIREAKYKR